MKKKQPAASNAKKDYLRQQILNNVTKQYENLQEYIGKNIE